MYDVSLLIRLSCLLPAVFAALFWLKPGRREAARYAMVLLPAGALFYLLAVYIEYGMLRYCLLHHVFASGALLVLLLGRYMLKCDWKRSLYAAGVYQLCFALAQMVVPPIFHGRYMEDWELSLHLDVTVLYVWLFVWICARKSGITRLEGFLTAAAIVACSTLLTGNLEQYTALLLHTGSPQTGMERMMLCFAALHSACGMLSFTLVMRLVHRQGWLRAVAYALLVELVYALAVALLGALAWMLR